MKQMLMMNGLIKVQGTHFIGKGDAASDFISIESANFL